MSDGLYLEIKKRNANHVSFNIEQYKGATMGRIYEKVDIYLDSFPFDVVYLCVGVNNITVKDRVTNQISFTWKTEDDLANHLIGHRDKYLELLKKDHPGAIVVFCPLIGLELCRVMQGSTEEQQVIVNKAIWRYNVALNKLKEELNFYFPYLAAPVHRMENGQHKSYYHHLPDGLHLSEGINKKWAAQFIKAFDRN